MPWLVGIDEAGYGPNLGPLVMTAVVCRVPPDLADINLWQVLRAAVRRARSRNTQKLLIEDSKLVYSPARGLLELERSVLSALFADLLAGTVCSLGRYVDAVSPHTHPELRNEAWYTGRSTLPAEAEPTDCAQAAERFRRACTARGITWGPVRSEVVCPARFNALLEHWGSKAASLGVALANLLRVGLVLDGDDTVTFLIDKHGGRNCYAALLQHAIPEGLVLAYDERSARSFYKVHGLGREVHIVFAPRADGTYLPVALASMVSKYLREVLMREFNDFWQDHVPGLRPTAGYPGDADRFLEEIRPALARLAIPETAVWRRR